MTKVVTFYSYKGGVGRTMALVNVAHVLARDGWRVLMADFDLEAPGMTHFFAEQVRNRPETVKYDALDLLLHAKSTINWDPLEKKPKPLEIPKSLAQYVVNIPLPDAWKDKVIPYRTGRLDLLPATLDPVEPEEAPEAEPSRSYLQRVDELDLQGVFDVGGPRHHFGNHVRQYFVNARFKTTGDILFTLRDKVWAAYDLVLIDSRTGLNEVAGLCIGPLCDALVICCGLNDQSIYGTKYFMEKAGLFDGDKAKPYTLVAGPVPPWHTREADERITLLRRELRAGSVAEIPYHPAAAFVEKHFVLDEPKEPITHAYERVAPLIARLTRPDRQERPEHWAMDLLMRARGEEDGWSRLQREVAEQLSDCRLRRSWPSLTSVGVLASFPTAAVVAALPGEARERTESGRWARIPFAAAVSAYRTNTDRAFRRAWRLLPDLVNESEEEEAVRLRVRLLFMHFRVLGTLPDQQLVYQVIHAASERTGKWTGREWVHRGDLALTVDLRMTVGFLAAMGQDTPVRVGSATWSGWEEVLLKSGETAWLLKGYPCWWLRMEEAPRGSWAKGLIEVASTLAIAAPGRKHVAKLACLLEQMRLPGPFSEMAGEPSLMSRRMLDPRMTHEIVFGEMHKGRSWADMPLGLWPEPLMASAVALVKGAEGVKEVLGWLMLARLVYGYAWRVLVDWRHLKSVKDHPLFVEFIRAEDQMVEEIESAIDRGEYPL